MLTSSDGLLCIGASRSEHMVVLTDSWVEIARAEWSDVGSGRVKKVVEGSGRA